MNKQKAKELFMQNYSCSQSAACAFAKECGLSEDQLKKAAIAFGRGFVHNESICGALTGVAIAAGLIAGGAEPSAKMEFANKFDAVVKAFKQKFGSINCADLVYDKEKLAAFRDLSLATEEEYNARPCLVLVFAAVDFAEKFLAENK